MKIKIDLELLAENTMVIEIKTIQNTISHAFDRAVNAVGVITLLLSFGTFGMAAFFYGKETGFYFSLSIFGICGSLEVFHRQAISNLNKRSQLGNTTRLFEWFLTNKPTWHVKIFQEFTYRGFFFRTIGFQEEICPFIVVGPLCPACQNHLAVHKRVKFPGRITINFVCICGFSAESKMTSEEMIKEVIDLGGLPIDK